VRIGFLREVSGSVFRHDENAIIASSKAFFIKTDMLDVFGLTSEQTAIVLTPHFAQFDKQLRQLLDDEPKVKLR